MYKYIYLSYPTCFSFVQKFDLHKFMLKIVVQVTKTLSFAEIGVPFSAEKKYFRPNTKQNTQKG